MGTDAAYPQYLQLLGVGLLWVNLHCAGMCGPLVVGLDLGGSSAEPGGRRYLAAFFNLLLYQCGRCITYGVMGALAGLGGQVFGELFERIARATSLVLALALVAVGAAGLLRVDIRGRLLAAGAPGGALSRMVGRLRALRGPWQRLLLGVVLGFLPCMIPLWVLGLAASTQSPLHGALLMVILVWMTSGVIFGFGLATAGRRREGGLRQRLLPLLLLLSGVWMGLIGAGANGWIGHASLGFTWHGKGYTIMFW